MCQDNPDLRDDLMGALLVNGVPEKLAKAALETKSWNSVEEMFKDLFVSDWQSAGPGELYVGIGGYVFEKPSLDECLMCGCVLDLGVCPHGCTETDGYAFMKGWHFGVPDDDEHDEYSKLFDEIHSDEDDELDDKDDDINF